MPLTRSDIIVLECLQGTSEPLSPDDIYQRVGGVVCSIPLILHRLVSFGVVNIVGSAPQRFTPV